MSPYLKTNIDKNLGFAIFHTTKQKMTRYNTATKTKVNTISL